MRLDSVLAIAAIVVALAGTYFPLRHTIRTDKDARVRLAEQDRQKAEAQMIDNAVTPWRERVADREAALAAMTSDRDHYRDLWDNRDTRDER